MEKNMEKEETKAKKRRKAPTKYETVILPRLEEIKAYLRAGGTKEGVAKQLKIAYSTFRKYKTDHPEFRAALMEAEEPANLKVENSLFERCMGGEREVKKAVKLKTVIYKNGKREKEEERVQIVTETVYVPPDTPAIKFWLTNRLPQKWRDKAENLNVDTKMTIEEYLLGVENGNSGRHEKVHRNVLKDQDEGQQDRSVRTK